MSVRFDISKVVMPETPYPSSLRKILGNKPYIQTGLFGSPCVWSDDDFPHPVQRLDHLVQELEKHFFKDQKDDKNRASYISAIRKLEGLHEQFSEELNRNLFKKAAWKTQEFVGNFFHVIECVINNKTPYFKTTLDLVDPSLVKLRELPTHCPLYKEALTYEMECSQEEREKLFQIKDNQSSPAILAIEESRQLPNGQHYLKMILHPTVWIRYQGMSNSATLMEAIQHEP
ncbi:MAG: hypothetical protein Q8L98_01355 [Chlamydiales bacterium]|nr:hypothetical protein [Chlamydiales bacterium]